MSRKIKNCFLLQFLEMFLLAVSRLIPGVFSHLLGFVFPCMLWAAETCMKFTSSSLVDYQFLFSVIINNSVHIHIQLFHSWSMNCFLSWLWGFVPWAHHWLDLWFLVWLLKSFREEIIKSLVFKVYGNLFSFLDGWFHIIILLELVKHVLNVFMLL